MSTKSKAFQKKVNEIEGLPKQCQHRYILSWSIDLIQSLELFLWVDWVGSYVLSNMIEFINIFKLYRFMVFPGSEQFGLQGSNKVSSSKSRPGRFPQTSCTKSLWVPITHAKAFWRAVNNLTSTGEMRSRRQNRTPSDFYWNFINRNQRSPQSPVFAKHFAPDVRWG